MQNVLSLSKRIPVVAKVEDDVEETKPVAEVIRKVRTWTTGYMDVS
jgi:PII-like signaling protein